jgi:hypothetical protein
MATIPVAEPIDKYTDEVAMFGGHMNEFVGLSRFQDYAYEYPGANLLTTKILDHFAAGDAEADIPAQSAEFEMGMLALIKWWREMQEMIGGMWRPNTLTGSDDPPVPGLDEAEAAMKRVRLVVAALITDTEEDDNPVPEFLRSYRQWTRSICAMGRKGWPGIDWSYLDQVV